MNCQRGHLGVLRIFGILLLLAMSLAWPCLADESGAWHQTSGPPGAKVNALQVDPRRPHLLYAGTNAGLFLSEDSGRSWRLALGETAPATEVYAIAIAPSDPDRVYVGTEGGQVLRSADAGQSWTTASQGLSAAIIWVLAVDPLIPTLVYAGSDALYRSTDGGDSWQALELPRPDIRRISALAIGEDRGALYAGTDAGLFVSSDGGESWRAAEGLPEGAAVQALLQASGTLCAATSKGIYCRGNGDMAWRGQDGMVATCLAQAENASVLYAGAPGKGLLRSWDKGRSWEVVGTEMASELVLALAVDPSHPRVLYAGTGSSIYRSEDEGASWQALTGIVASAVQTQALGERPGHLVAATRWGLYWTRDGGQSWQASRAPAEISALALARAGDGKLFYAGTWQSQLYRSTDGGASWELIHGDVASGAAIAALALLPDALYAGSDGQGVFVSLDGGSTWRAINEGLSNRHVRALAAHQAARKLYAGTQQGAFSLDLSRGQDRAAWETLRGLPADEIRSLIVSEGSGAVYAASPHELFVSRDGGRSWVALGGAALQAHDVEIQACAVPEQRGRAVVIYLGTDRGVLATHDGGRNWSFILPGLWVDTLSVETGRPHVLYAGARNRGIWRGTDLPPRAFPWAPLLAAVGLLVAGGASVAVMLGRRRKPKERTPAELLEENWTAWDQLIKEALMREGKAATSTLAAIPESLRRGALECYLEVHPEENLVWDEGRKEVRAVESRRIEAFLRNWRAAQSHLEDAAAFRAAASRLVNQFCNFMGFNRVTSRTYKEWIGFVVEGVTLRIRLPSRFPIVCARKAQVGPEDVQDLRNLMDILHMGSYFALVLVFSDEARKLQELAKAAAAHDFVVLDFQDVFQTLISRRPEQELTQRILRQVDLTVVSPYVIYGPVPDKMFFGRDQEIKTIIRTIQEQSFALVGGRKIGKTSVLLQVNRLLKETPGFAPLYLDCQAVHDYEEFLAAAMDRWQVELSNTSRTPEAFAEVLRAAADLQGCEGKLPVVLLDEVDALLAYDVSQGEKLFSVFRAMSQENRCRFVFCGERTLHARLQDASSPLFNFATALHLSYLTPEAMRQMVLEPMQEMGIQVQEPDALVAAITALTSGHPNLVQYLCQQMLVEINDSSPRLINQEVLSRVSGSRYFAEYALALFWGSATPLEKAITLLMIEHPLVTPDELLKVLQEGGIVVERSAVLEALEHLVLCSVLDRQRQYYAFAAHSFPDIVEGSQDVPALLEALKAQIMGAG